MTEVANRTDWAVVSMAQANFSTDSVALVPWYCKRFGHISNNKIPSYKSIQSNGSFVEGS